MNGTMSGRAPTCHQRFDAIEAHPTYSAAVARTPRMSAVAELAEPVLSLVGVAIFAAVIGSEIIPDVTRSSRTDATVEIAFFAVFALVAFGIVGHMLWTRVAFLTAPLRPTTAIVIAQRSGTHQKRRISYNASKTAYFTTLQLRDGTRVELLTGGELAGLITTGDAGVAHVKGDRLVGFARIGA